MTRRASVAAPSEPPMREIDLQNAIIETAHRLHFYVYHAMDSRMNEPGFPDLVIVGHGRAWFLELKTKKGKLRPSSFTKRGRFQPGQQEWIDEMQRAGLQAMVVRPDALDWIQSQLKDAYESREESAA